MSVRLATSRLPLNWPFVVAFVLVAGVSAADACECIGFPAPMYLRGSDLVFVGTVERIVTPAPRTEEATIRIERRLRGKFAKRNLTIVSRGLGVSCDADFEPLTRYLVFASRAADGSWKSGCSGTTRLESDFGKASLKAVERVLALERWTRFRASRVR